MEKVEEYIKLLELIPKVWSAWVALMGHFVLKARRVANYFQMVLPTHHSHLSLPPPLHTSRRKLVGYVGASTPSISIKWTSIRNIFQQVSQIHGFTSSWIHVFPSYIFLSLVGCRNSSQSFHLIVTPRLARWKA